MRNCLFSGVFHSRSPLIRLQSQLYTFASSLLFSFCNFLKLIWTQCMFRTFRRYFWLSQKWLKLYKVQKRWISQVLLLLNFSFSCFSWSFFCFIHKIENFKNRRTLPRSVHLLKSKLKLVHVILCKMVIKMDISVKNIFKLMKALFVCYFFFLLKSRNTNFVLNNSQICKVVST